MHGKPVLTFKNWAVVVFEWTLSLQHNKEFITVIFLFNIWFYRCLIFKLKRLIREAFWVLLQAMFTERLNGTAIKITIVTTNYQ